MISKFGENEAIFGSHRAPEKRWLTNSINSGLLEKELGSNILGSTKKIKNSMKKIYSSPRLVQYGTVNELTRISNDSQATDVGTFENGEVVQTGHGSSDGIIVPQ